ncbi:MAG: hypothetical protein QM723_32685 [Myxococcaceae bacterium]
MRPAAAVAILLLPTAALATPHLLPYTYGYATNPAESFEVEQYVDLTPVPAFDTQNNQYDTFKAILTTELEYGLTDRLEVGLYLQLSNDPGSGTGQWPLFFDGLKERARLRLAEPGEWPVDVSLYLELAELATEFEVEGKVNLERRLGPVTLLANLWLEREQYYRGVGEWAFNPTGGVSVQLHPAIHLGLEYWMRWEFGGPANSAQPARHFLGPALLLQSKKVWLSVAPYLRLDNWNTPARVGDLYGRVYVRAIIGVEL